MFKKVDKKSLIKVLAIGFSSMVLFAGTNIVSNANSVQASSTLTVLKFKSNAYEYTKNGRRANDIYVPKGSSYYSKGSRYIHGKKYYIIKASGHRYYIKSGNIRTIVLTRKIKVIHNSYVYNKHGNRLFSQGTVTPGKYFLYGTRHIDGNKYYEIGDGMYIKGGNVADSNTAKTTINHKSTTKDKALQPYRTVYISYSQDDPLYQPAMEAINEWNNTGAITFKVISDKDKANIDIEKEYKPGASWAGEDRYFDDDGRTKKDILSERFNSTILYNASDNYGDHDEKVIFEHELGHAIGLDHNHDRSIMNIDQGTDGNAILYSLDTIQPKDIANVKSMFNEN